MTSKKSSALKPLLTFLLVPLCAGVLWFGYEYLSFRHALARWNPEKAPIEALNDIKSGTMKIYMHGTIASWPVGVEKDQLPLIKKLPKVNAGVGCNIENFSIRAAQGEYATRYNRTIVQYLQSQVPST